MNYDSTNRRGRKSWRKYRDANIVETFKLLSFKELDAQICRLGVVEAAENELRRLSASNLPKRN